MPFALPVMSAARNAPRSARCWPPPSLFLVALLVLLGLDGGRRVSGAVASEPVSLDPRFVVEKHWSQTGWTVALRFARNCTDVFAAEKSGLIRWYPSIDAAETDFVELGRLPASHYEDRGLLGFAVHPQFPSAPFVYALYTDGFVKGRPFPYDQCPAPVFVAHDDIARCPATQKLVRLRVDVARRVLVSQRTLITAWCIVGRSHGVGDLQWAADGSLLVSAGDGSTYEAGGDVGVPGDGCFDPAGPRLQGAFRSQADQYLNGKILLIRPGALIADLPGPLKVGVDFRIVAKGLRNPYRMATHPRTGDVYIGDVGASAAEEIDVLPNPANADRGSGAVPNFGWPCLEGRRTAPDYAGDAASMAYCKSVDPVAIQPFFEYSHERGALPSPCEGESSSPTGIGFYPNAHGRDAFPQVFQDTMFWLEGSKRCVLFFENDAKTGLPDPTKLRVLVHTPGTGDRPGQFADIQFDQRGRMFLVDVYTSTIYRVVFRPQR